MRQTDYIIVGQGIAGSVLALTLLQKGKTVAVIDNPRISSASKIAAGIFNPFNAKWMLNTWRAREITPVATNFYSAAEKLLGQTFFTQREILRIFADERQRKMWEKACETKRELYTRDAVVENPFPGIVHAPFGCGIIEGGGNVHAGKFVEAAKIFLQKKQMFFEENFIAEKLELHTGGVTYDNRIAAKILVSCAGIAALHNTFFGFLPLRPVKGQLLHVKIPGLKTEHILNSGIYLLPTGDEHFICGATYEEESSDEEISEAAKNELLGKLKKIVRTEIVVEQQFAAVRPASPDRHPLAGRHPQFPQLAVMNGMGSKGILLSPWIAEQLVNHLENDTALPEEIDVRNKSRMENVR